MTARRRVKRLPVSVLVPTIGRPDLLRQCLRSLAACSPLPAEILVSDQSGDPATARTVAEFAGAGARLVPCPGRGIGRAINRVLAEATEATVMVTHDDCTVAPDWVAAGDRHMTGYRHGMVTGRVMPVGDPRRVPSTKTDHIPWNFTRTTIDVLYPMNMACDREALVAMGGFDEQLVPAAEDNDLCYRWTKAGRPLRYVPDMTVFHHDWRSIPDLKRMYVGYARGQGMFFAKHLRAGDVVFLRYIVREFRHAAVGLAIRALTPWRRRPPDWRTGVFTGLPVGLWRGWRTFR